MRDDLDMKEFRVLLETQREELLGRRDAHKETTGTVQLDQSRIGRLARMDALQQQAMAMASDARSAGKLQRIEAALVRIRAGEFGYCIRCGEDIAVKRLMADPASIHCLTCAALSEKQ